MGAALLNMLMAYVVFMVSRLAFFFENYATFAPDMSWGLAISMLKGSLEFDTSALLYINSLYLVLCSCRGAERSAWISPLPQVAVCGD